MKHIILFLDADLAEEEIVLRFSDEQTKYFI